MLFHRDLGGAGRPPLLILPGFLGSTRNWQTAGAGLAAGFHVCALDLRNHGQSPAAPTMSFDELVGDVLEWLDAQAWTAPTILGHSLGGKVAMRLACRHSNRVARLIAVDIAPKAYPGMAQRGEVAAMNALRLDDLHSRAEAEIRLEGQVPSLAMRRFLVSNLERAPDGSWRWAINLPVLTAALPELVRTPLDPGEQYTGPTLAVLGGKSRFVDPGDHLLLRQHFPAVRILTMPESGHNPHIEARDAFVQLVLAEGGA